ELLGVYVSGHPLDEFTHVLQRRELVPMDELPLQRDQASMMIAGLVNEAKVITTRKGATMAVVLVEDKFHQVELVVFPSSYKQFSFLLKQGEFIIVRGRLDKKEEKVKMIVDHVWDLVKVAKEKE